MTNAEIKERLLGRLRALEAALNDVDWYAQILADGGVEEDQRTEDDLVYASEEIRDDVKDMLYAIPDHITFLDNDVLRKNLIGSRKGK